MLFGGTVLSILVTCSYPIVPAFSFAATGIGTIQGQPASLAQQAPTPTQEDVINAFNALDLNGDGLISMSELGQFARNQSRDPLTLTGEFSALDADRNNGLNVAEFTSALYEVNLRTNGVDQPVAATRTFPKQLSAVRPISSLVTSDKSSAAAEEAAAMVVDQLSVEAREEKAALDLENQASELRANASAMRRIMSQRALAAGVAAAQKKANELLASLVELEDAARQNEVQAASLRANSIADLKQAQELSTFVDSALNLASAK